MQSIEIAPNVQCLSIVDWNLRDFHGYQTEKGSTYNAYLVKGEKTALFDTTKASYTGEFVDGLKKVVDPAAIDYMIVNHAEMDHSGALPEIMKIIRPEKLYCTANAQKTLLSHFDGGDWPFEIIKEGDVLDLGGKTVEFIGSPMLHWPESMVSFLKEDNVLISNDIFGQHWATNERFDDMVDQGELYFQAAKYYANIFYPVSAGMRKFLAKLEKKQIRPALLACDHGLLWRKDIAGIMRKYIDWSEQKNVAKAVIVYDTMWESTARMARAVADGLDADGVSVRVFDLRYNNRSDIITEILEARAVIVGSSVLNKNILPKMADVLTYMKGLAPQNKMAAAFGSYGWQDTIVKQLNAMLEEMKFELVDDGVSANYVPGGDDLARCFDLGAKIRQKILGA
jgi:flavorubredoxin